jgi:glutamyl/glutaminyl-tRNA synthetase
MGLRLMLTGETHGPELHKILMLIGRENLLQRLM